jgi:ABC-2 type transport system permease protein
VVIPTEHLTKVYPGAKIGQGIGGKGAAEESAFATTLVPGVVGISIMFQGVQSIALAMAQEFGYTREIEDRSRRRALSGW